MFTALFIAIVVALVIIAFGFVAGIISYLRDPMAVIRRQQHRDNLARISSL